MRVEEEQSHGADHAYEARTETASGKSAVAWFDTHALGVHDRSEHAFEKMGGLFGAVAH